MNEWKRNLEDGRAFGPVDFDAHDDGNHDDRGGGDEESGDSRRRRINVVAVRQRLYRHARENQNGLFPNMQIKKKIQS